MTVAIIGAGASGILTAHALHRRCPGRDLVMIDPYPPGGPAYRAPEPWHLLNSRAGAMGDDFAARAGDPDAFVARAHYGDHLRALLAETRADLRADRAVRITRGPGGLVVHLAHGLPIRAADVVLALGPPRPAVPAFLAGHPDVVPDPWAPGALDVIDPARPVVVAGTGLTAVDVALTLLRRDRTAPITLVSRRGLLPQAHQRVRPEDARVGDLVSRARSLRSLVRGIRELSERHPGGWRPVIDAVRPHANALWAAASDADRARFLRHCARHWDVHRHRMAAPIAAELDRHRASGVLRVRALGVPAKDLDLEGVQVVNAAGPGLLPEAADPLTAALLADGLATAGPHGLGLETAAPLWVVGPMRRGRLWETTAIPEIRDQADTLARALPRAYVPEIAA
ncbi:putative NAD(P)/FAD-binding protein YdhS [Catenuloplanes nepalensis]|uniref:NAD(P)/FAD-binding protein YdhS n=1 Tax=Catenuloplanes nepalensis TaxID=587533 RepID=A0ABT9MV81_9ACTN|nr:FAD/NAD(P)-binding protein [Catenuloplanes nepalensis]MDP9795354.1 putative NAD(P)/FAD-binding protein YdhS [Catenuloplanes nepalensis]